VGAKQSKAGRLPSGTHQLGQSVKSVTESARAIRRTPSARTVAHESAVEPRWQGPLHGDRTIGDLLVRVRPPFGKPEARSRPLESEHGAAGPAAWRALSAADRLRNRPCQ